MRASRTIRREVNGDAARREAPLTNAIGLSWPEAAAAEHEMRGLLHLLGMISYCLQFSPATEDERARWRREAACANARLERLRTAGWCPGL